jgi:hypothetical protein
LKKVLFLGKNIINYKHISKFIKDKNLNMEIILSKFHDIMYEEYREKDSKFIEREGRLLFLCFLKPIINGDGFYFVEPETRLDNRMDIVVVYNNKQFIIELKIWHGENYEEKAINQLTSYLESKNETTGYLISFNFNKDKKYKKEWLKNRGKNIFNIVV